MTDMAPPPIVPPPTVPPATIGLLGGGPTTRYFEHAAQQMGYRTLVIDPKLAARALMQAAKECSVVTVVDQLPLAAMRRVAAKVPVHPSPDVVELCMDRIAEKRFLEDLGIGVGPHMLIESEDDIVAAADTKFPAILKLRHHGGGRHGQVRIAAHVDLPEAWQALGRRPCVLEQRLPLGRELSIIVARSGDGSVATYPVAQQQYVHGKLEVSYAPASLLGSGQADGAELAAFIATELGIIGVLTVHMFVVGREVYVHEMIPQPSVLGLYTLDSCRTNQYEQQLRAVCGLGLGASAMTAPGIAVVSLPGELWADGEPKWERVLSEGTAHVHRYDGVEPGDGVIAGHLAAASGTAAGSTSVVRRLRKQLTTS
ncbi:MAG: ATP-grasp domain-containing protein [Actinomycetia bacterium]|nr:ATP-grasp domain-containing protein [Actinomycetes bacterium]